MQDFSDPKRKILRISLCPHGQYVACADNLARVSLWDLRLGCFVRVWKGVRDARLSWAEDLQPALGLLGTQGSLSTQEISTSATSTPTPTHTTAAIPITPTAPINDVGVNAGLSSFKKLPLSLGIYSPRTGLLSFYGMPQGDCLCTLPVGIHSLLLTLSLDLDLPLCFREGANSVKASNAIVLRATNINIANADKTNTNIAYIAGNGNESNSEGGIGMGACEGGSDTVLEFIAVDPFSYVRSLQTDEGTINVSTSNSNSNNSNSNSNNSNSNSNSSVQIVGSVGTAGVIPLTPVGRDSRGLSLEHPGSIAESHDVRRFATPTEWAANSRVDGGLLGGMSGDRGGGGSGGSDSSGYLCFSLILNRTGERVELGTPAPRPTSTHTNKNEGIPIDSFKGSSIPNPIHNSNQSPNQRSTRVAFPALKGRDESVYKRAVQLVSALLDVQYPQYLQQSSHTGVDMGLPLPEAGGAEAQLADLLYDPYDCDYDNSQLKEAGVYYEVGEGQYKDQQKEKEGEEKEKERNQRGHHPSPSGSSTVDVSVDVDADVSVDVDADVSAEGGVMSPPLAAHILMLIHRVEMVSEYRPVACMPFSPTQGSRTYTPTSGPKQAQHTMGLTDQSLPLGLMGMGMGGRLSLSIHDSLCCALEALAEAVSERKEKEKDKDKENKETQESQSQNQNKSTGNSNSNNDSNSHRHSKEEVELVELERFLVLEAEARRELLHTYETLRDLRHLHRSSSTSSSSCPYSVPVSVAAEEANRVADAEQVASVCR